MKQKILIIIAFFVVCIAIISSIYFFFQYQKAQMKPKDPSVETIAAVGKLIMLPEGEEPTVATISDIEKLKDQAFFTHAQNGDKVLIYTTAKKAILYRAETNKIIDVAPVNMGGAASPSAVPKK